MINRATSRRGLLAAAALAGGMFLAAPGAHADCGRVTIANMNWASAELAANVDKLILEEGYDCRVELVPGDTMPTTTSMTEKAEPDIAPEIWMNSVRQVIDKAVNEGRLKTAGDILSDGGQEGFWIPRYMIDEHPELTTLEAVLERPDLFPHPEDSSRGAIHNCPVGWNCEIITHQLHNAFEMQDKGFDLVDTGSAAGLDGSIAKAFEREEPWFGYYWAPTAILGKYDLVRLDMGVDHDPDEWDRCTGQPYEGENPCNDPKPNDWTKSVVTTVTSATFADEAPEAYEYLTNRSWSNDVVNGMLAFMDDEQASGEFAAEEFIMRHPDVWTEWVPEDVAAKIKAAM